MHHIDLGDSECGYSEEPSTSYMRMFYVCVQVLPELTNVGITSKAENINISCQCYWKLGS